MEHRISILIEKEVWEEFKTVVKAENENPSALIRKYIKAYIKEKKAKTIIKKQ